MSFYPMMLDLSGKLCLVAGGGRVAVRKVIGLLRAGARVRVVSPEINRHFNRLESCIDLVKRPMEKTDIHPRLALVIAATNDSRVNQCIYRQAQKQAVLCNVVDCPELCTFILPAVVRRGPLVVSVSTGGSNPRLARQIKMRISEAIGQEYVGLALYLKEVRERVMRDITKQALRARFWEDLFEDDPMGFIEKNGWDSFHQRAEKIIAHYTQQAGEY